MAEPVYTVASDSETTGEEKTSPSFPESAIGIDIGTSQCSVAIWSGSHVELLKNTRDLKLMKSYVTFKDDIPFSGITSQLSQDHETLSGSAIFNMKRLIGRVDTDPVVQLSKTVPFLVQTLGIGGRPFIAALVNNIWRSTTPEEVLAIFLVELRAMVENQLKRSITNVVLTVPVSFSRFQLSRIERVCAMAGLHVLRLMPEPTAVALLYAQQLQTVNDSLGSGMEKIALIFNMGAGYCDVSLTATAGGVSQIKALSGYAVGGENILKNMMHYLVPNLDSLFVNHGVNEIKLMGLLRVATQDAIHKLSEQDMVQVDLDLGNWLKISKVINREEFEEVNKKVFDICECLVDRCLRDAKVDVEDLSDVILVGGCSNIPKIKRLVKNICKREDLYPGMNVLEAAVCGAALEGAVALGISDPFGHLDLLTIQVTPMSIGIRGDNNKFVRIVQKNTTIPARKDMVFTTMHDQQQEALVFVYEGDEEEKLEANHLLGFFKIGIPLAPKGVPEINICMDIDASNVLRVLTGVTVSGAQGPVSLMEVRMPTVDDGHGWCAEALRREYGSRLDLVLVQKKITK